MIGTACFQGLHGDRDCSLTSVIHTIFHLTWVGLHARWFDGYGSCTCTKMHLNANPATFSIISVKPAPSLAFRFNLHSWRVHFKFNIVGSTFPKENCYMCVHSCCQVYLKIVVVIACLGVKASILFTSIWLHNAACSSSAKMSFPCFNKDQVWLAFMWRLWAP